MKIGILRRWIVITAGLLLLATGPSVKAQFNYIASNGVITITGYTGSGGAVTVPSIIDGLPVADISTNAFYYETRLNSVTLPDTLTDIGANAFEGCSKMTSLTLGSNVTYIEDYAFRDCAKLTNVSIPDSVTHIGAHAFYSSGIESINIPDSVTNIGSDPFSFCANLSNVTIAATATNLQWNTYFSSCPHLASIEVTSNNPTYTSLDGVVFDKLQATLMRCPPGKLGSYTISNTVTTILRGAFQSCSGLTNVTVPDTLAPLLGTGLFAGAGFSGVTLPKKVPSIAFSAFSECRNLANIEIPDGATSIGVSAFLACSALTNVTIPDSVTSIGDEAFYGCLSLTSITIPKSVTDLGNAVFLQSGLTAALVDCAVIGQDAFAFCPLTNLTLGDDVTKIGEGAFDGCWMASLLIPSGVTEVEAGAFSDCRNLTNVVIGSRVTSIDVQAFQGCTQVKAFYFLGDAPSVGSEAFSLDTLATVYRYAGATGWGSTFGGLPVVTLNPSFTIMQTANQAAFSWPAASGFVLEQSSLLVPGSWSPAGPLVTFLTNGGVVSTIAPTAGGNLFYRLHRQ